MSIYDVKLVDTKLMRPGEGFFKVYFFQNEGRERLWLPGEVEYVGEKIEQSPFTQEGMGVVVSFAPKEGGISKVVYFYPDMKFLTTEPLCFRNPDFEDPNMEYPMESSLTVLGDGPDHIRGATLREGFCWGELAAVAFEQDMLSSFGEAEYRTRLSTTFFRPRATGTGRLTHKD